MGFGVWGLGPPLFPHPREASGSGFRDWGLGFGVSEVSGVSGVSESFRGVGFRVSLKGRPSIEPETAGPARRHGAPAAQRRGLAGPQRRRRSGPQVKTRTPEVVTPCMFPLIGGLGFRATPNMAAPRIKKIKTQGGNLKGPWDNP